MDPAFWTTGPVPLHRLSDHAIPRPGALTRCLESLETDGTATLGGASGTGRTTLAFQIAVDMDRTALLFDHSAILDPEEDLDRLLARGLRTRGDPWRRLQEWPPRRRAPLLVAEEPPDGFRERLESIASKRTPILFLRREGDITPDPVPDVQAALHLQRRTRSRGYRWRSEALAMIVSTAAGSPQALQWLGHLCLDVAHQRGSKDLEEEDAVEAAAIAAHHLPSGLAKAIGAIRGARLALLKAMARNPDGGPTDWAHQCGIEPKTAIVHLGRLRDDGLVERTGRGRYRPISPLLALHLKARHGSPVLRIGTGH